MKRDLVLVVVSFVSLVACVVFIGLRVRSGFDNIALFALPHHYTILATISLWVFILAMRAMGREGVLRPHFDRDRLSLEEVIEKLRPRTYIRLCYNLLGRRLDRRPDAALLRKLSGAEIYGVSPGTFIALMIITPIICGFIAFGILFALLKLSLLHSLFISLLAAGSAAGFFPLLIHTKRYNRMKSIERELPFVLSHMSIMAGTGATPLKTIESIAVEEYGEISSEFRKLIYRTNVQGEDAITALDNLAMSTPSEVFKELCLDLANLIHIGGDLRKYLEDRSTYLMDRRRLVEKQFIETLGIYSEFYIGGIMLIVIMGIVGIITAGALGYDFGLSLETIFDLFIYLAVPALNGLFLLVLELMYLD